MAATKKRMGSNRAQRDPAATVETRPAASQTTKVANGSIDDNKHVASFRRSLLRWYDQHRRTLPWRETRDPYRIWLSEIMLQQTRVAAVLDHYRIFLERFPTVQALAAASEDAVLATWSGLGYYRRARMLHRCARQIAQQGGLFPQNSATLRTLPGIGRYTAAAVASIAFSEPTAVVDGNVERVLQRFTGLNLSTAQIWQRAQALLDAARPGDFNQAMMELGATVCVPREPNCSVCPVKKWCATPRPMTMERRASPRRRIAPPPPRQIKKTIWCVIIRRNGSVRLVQRAEKDSLMPGMWELPHSSEPPALSSAAGHWRTFRHSITVTNYTVHVLKGTNSHLMPLQFAPPVARAKWIATDRIPHIPITGLTRKILKAGGII
jgi:A/G-specific adenine glycosylase